MSLCDEYDVELVNVVGGGDAGINFDLEKLFYKISHLNAEYEPETHAGVILKLPKSKVTAMIFSSGKYHLTGANSIEELKKSNKELSDLLMDSGITSELNNTSVEVRNMVYKGDFGRELDLSQISLALGYENVEYDPSSFPGVFYYLENGTAILFRTGKFVVTGVTDAESAQDIIGIFTSQIQSLLENEK